MHPQIRLVPENGKLEIELAGDLAGIQALASGSKKPAMRGHDGLQVTLVAGTRNTRFLRLIERTIPKLAA
jgi:site-specific DNA recombinase